MVDARTKQTLFVTPSISAYLAVSEVRANSTPSIHESGETKFRPTQPSSGGPKKMKNQPPSKNKGQKLLLQK